MLVDSDVHTLKREQTEVEDRALYTGHWTGSQKHGKGNQVWPDGMRYDGYWARDEHNGFGRMIYPDGSYYIGYW